MFSKNIYRLAGCRNLFLISLITRIFMFRMSRSERFLKYITTIFHKLYLDGKCNFQWESWSDVIKREALHLSALNKHARFHEKKRSLLWVLIMQSENIAVQILLSNGHRHCFYSWSAQTIGRIEWKLTF